MALIAPAHLFLRDLTPELNTSHNAASAKINENENIVIWVQNCRGTALLAHFALSVFFIIWK